MTLTPDDVIDDAYDEWRGEMEAWMDAHPDATPAERRSAMEQITKKYLRKCYRIGVNGLPEV